MSSSIPLTGSGKTGSSGPGAEVKLYTLDFGNGEILRTLPVSKKKETTETKGVFGVIGTSIASFAKRFQRPAPLLTEDEKKRKELLTIIGARKRPTLETVLQLHGTSLFKLVTLSELLDKGYTWRDITKVSSDIHVHFIQLKPTLGDIIELLTPPVLPDYDSPPDIIVSESETTSGIHHDVETEEFITFLFDIMKRNPPPLSASDLGDIEHQSQLLNQCPPDIIRLFRYNVDIVKKICPGPSFRELWCSAPWPAKLWKEMGLPTHTLVMLVMNNGRKLPSHWKKERDLALWEDFLAEMSKHLRKKQPTSVPHSRVTRT